MGFGMTRRSLGLLGFAAAISLVMHTQANAQDKPLKIKMAVAGINYLQYIPMVLAKELGEFQRVGLDVEITNFKNGTSAAAAVVSNTVDVAAGYYEHGLLFAAKGKDVRTFALVTNMRGEALFVTPQASKDINSIKDLVGKTIGITAPGSSTDFMLKYILRKNGIDPSAVSVIAMGEPASSVAAISQGLVQAALIGEPGITMLQNKFGEMKMLVDTRNEAGSRGLFGTDYPAAGLYANADWIASHQEEARRLAVALVATLRWMHKNKPADIVAKMPTDIVGPDAKFYQEVYESLQHIFSKDGVVELAATKSVYLLVKDANPGLFTTDPDLSKTFTNDYVAYAKSKLGD
jgi:NitT/TauT family transport system substrate-binding protein